jgi:hypothetical protein
LSSVTFSSAALAGPPLATDDAGTVKVGTVEIETNVSYTDIKETAGASTTRTKTTGAELKLSTGLYKNMNISLAVPRTMNQRTESDGAHSSGEGFGDMTVELKYAFAEMAGVNLAIKPGLVLPTGAQSMTGHYAQYGATLIASKEFGEGRFAVHANLGYEFHASSGVVESGRRSLWSGSFAGEAEVTKGLFVVVDAGLAPNSDNNSQGFPPFALAGIRYDINDHLTFSIGCKMRVTRPEDDYAIQSGVLLKVP